MTLTQADLERWSQAAQAARTRKHSEWFRQWADWLVQAPADPVSGTTDNGDTTDKEKGQS